MSSDTCGRSSPICRDAAAHLTSLPRRIEVSEREYTYLSMSGGYTPYDKCIKHLFWRVLWKVGVPNPHDFATAEDLDFILHAFSDMEMRPGVRNGVWTCKDSR